MVPDRTGLVAVVFILSCGLARDVPAQQLKPGEFVREFGRGELVITRENKRGLHFILYASGKNAHTCGLEGEIREDVAALNEPGSSAPCKVRFRIIPVGIRVSVEENPETCRQLCGIGEGFDGDYEKPALGCTPTALRATRTAFKRAYDVKAYTKARLLLEPVLTRCARTLSAIQWGQSLNDVAIAQYRSGDLKACRRTLMGFGPDLEDTEEEVHRNLLPSDAENWWPVVSAARTNMKLCRASR